MNDRRGARRARAADRRTIAPRSGAQARRKRHLALVLHGARAEYPELRHVVEWVRAKGHTLRARVTWEPGDGTVFAREAIDAGADTVVACGGDGTVNEVVNGLEGTRVALGIIPAGTANDFARQVGIPDDANAAMDIVLRRKPVVIDTAAMNGRRFLNVSSGGVGAEATAETPSDAKASLGPVAYFISGLRKLAALEPRRALFEAPGYSSGDGLPVVRGRKCARDGRRLARDAAGERARWTAGCVHHRRDASARIREARPSREAWRAPRERRRAIPAGAVAAGDVRASQWR